MQNTRLAILLFLLSGHRCFCEPTPDAIAVRLSVKAQNYVSLGDAILDIRITNLTDHAITAETVDDPPTNLEAKTENGKEAVKVVLLSTSPRRPKRYDFRLEPHRPETYVKPLREFLGPGQSLADIKSDTFDVKVILVIVSYDGANRRIASFRSNSVKVRVKRE